MTSRAVLNGWPIGIGRPGGGPVNPAPTLGGLSLSSSLRSGTLVTATLMGWSPGSTIVSNIPGMAQPVFAAGAWTITGTPTGGAQTIANALVETLAGATNTPRSTSLNVLGVAPLNPIVVGDGDSILQLNSENMWGKFAAKHPDLEQYNIAVGGSGLGFPSERAAGTANSLWGRLNLLLSKNPTIVVLGLMGGNEHPDEGGTAACDAYLARQWAEIAQLRIDRPGVLVGMLPMTPRGSNFTKYLAYNVLRRYTNNQFAAAVGNQLDFFIDWRDDEFLDNDALADDLEWYNPRPGDPTKTDGQHPKGPYHDRAELFLSNSLDQIVYPPVSGPATAPVLTKTSTTGFNPMSWSSAYSNMKVDDDKIANRWRVNGGAWTNEVEQEYTTEIWEETRPIVWPLYAAYTFAPGDVVLVQEGVHRGSDAIVWSNTVSDTMVDAAEIIAGVPYFSNDYGSEGYGPSFNRSFAFGAGHRLIAIYAREAVTGLTIDGVAATPLPMGGHTTIFDYKLSLWRSAAAGAAGNSAISATFAGGIGQIAAHPATGKNLGSVTFSNVASATGGAAVTLSPTFPPNGVGIAFVASVYGGSFAWAGATELTDVNLTFFGENAASSMARVTAAGPIQATPSAGNSYLIAVGFNHA